MAFNDVHCPYPDVVYLHSNRLQTVSFNLQLIIKKKEELWHKCM